MTINVEPRIEKHVSRPPMPTEKIADRQNDPWKCEDEAVPSGVASASPGRTSCTVTEEQSVDGPAFNSESRALFMSFLYDGSQPSLIVSKRNITFRELFLKSLLHILQQFLRSLKLKD